MPDDDRSEVTRLRKALEAALEPNTAGDTDHEHAVCSIAISLKRIADALTASDYDNPIHNAIMNGIANGAQEWIGHMARSGR